MRNVICFSAVSMMAVLCAAAPSLGQSGDSLNVYIGTNTSGQSKGIYVCRLNLGTGALSTPVLAAEAKNPTFLTIHPNGRCLFAVTEVDTGGGVSAFAIQPDGLLSKLNDEPSGGAGPCHVALDRLSKTIFVANYGSGSVASLPVEGDGRLKAPVSVVQNEGKSVNPQRQTGPHAHSMNASPDNRFVFGVDLGLDKIFSYKLDASTGKLTPNAPPATLMPPGSGPRHLAFHPDGTHAFVINELANTITVLNYDATKGTLTPGQTVSTLPPGFAGVNTTSEVGVHPSGKFVYGANRGHDSIAAFAFDTKSATLTTLGQTPSGGTIPRNFGIDPSGNFLLTANQESGTVGVFRIDPQQGGLTAVGDPVPVPSAMCVRFLKMP